jgi:hypothetical protein
LRCPECDGRGFVYARKVEDMIAIREIAAWLGLTKLKPSFSGRHGHQMDAPLYEVCKVCGGHDDEM